MERYSNLVGAQMGRDEVPRGQSTGLPSLGVVDASQRREPREGTTPSGRALPSRDEVER